MLFQLAMCLHAAGSAAPAASGITVCGNEGCNLEVLRELPPECRVLDKPLELDDPGVADPTDVNPDFASLANRVFVKLKTPAHNWFAATFDNIPPAQTSEVVLCMTGNDVLVNRANVAKWVGLRPVVSYADPMRLEGYEWFRKDAQGRWVSSDPGKTGDARFAGAGKVPEQRGVPAECAEQFLSADGTTWCPWRDLPPVVADLRSNTIRIPYRFAMRKATVAMRTPYLDVYLQAYLARLQAGKYPGLHVDEMGVTPGGRKLSAIRLEPSAGAQPAGGPTILVYSREHATEPDGSWVIEGMLRWLISADPEAVAARAQCNWLLIPLLDPDGAAAAEFRVGDIFVPVRPVAPEAMAVGRYLIDWVDAGHRLEIAVSLHNVECGEGPQFYCPLINYARRDLAPACNKTIFTALTEAGFSVGGAADPEEGFAGTRLHGWCFRVFRTFDLAYELNCRYPKAPLSVPQLCDIGGIMARQLAVFTRAPQFDKVRTEMIQALAAREKDRKAWWAMTGRDAQRRNFTDILQKGY